MPPTSDLNFLELKPLFTRIKCKRSSILRLPCEFFKFQTWKSFLLLKVTATTSFMLDFPSMQHIRCSGKGHPSKQKFESKTETEQKRRCSLLKALRIVAASNEDGQPSGVVHKNFFLAAISARVSSKADFCVNYGQDKIVMTGNVDTGLKELNRGLW